MKYCDKNHPVIWHNGTKCPCCELDMENHLLRCEVKAYRRLEGEVSDWANEDVTDQEREVVLRGIQPF